MAKMAAAVTYFGCCPRKGTTKKGEGGDTQMEYWGSRAEWEEAPGGGPGSFSASGDSGGEE